MEDSPNNIILLTIDALRRDHVSAYGYDRETTPTLDRFAANNVRFSNPYSASTNTREAVPALLTGRYPSECVDEAYELASDTIATQLRDTEYTTGAFHSNPYVSRGYGFDRDFDAFDDDLYLGSNKLVALAQRALDKLRNRHYARAEVINERALDWIGSVEEPFFLWNHYMDVHAPYSPPREYQEIFHDEYVGMERAQTMYKRAAITDPESITDAERREMVNLYDEEIRYFDARLEVFLDELDSQGLLDESLLIITADHGDAFDEHGYYGHPRQLDEELIQVPLLVSVPDDSEGEVSPPTTTLDIIPTVLEAAGVAEATLPGESLFDIVSDPEAYQDRMVFSQARGDDRYDEEHIRRFRADSQDAWARVERVIESGEVLSSEPEGSVLLEELLEHSEGSLDGASTIVSERTGSKDVERRLEALGYKE
jgi:arylsulfatase